jgi:hypothetical protein
MEYTQTGPVWAPFHYTLLPYIEQDNIHRRAFGSGAAWGAGNNSAVVKTYLCPADTSHNSGLGPNTGWAVTSYSNTSPMFASAAAYDPSTGVYQMGSRYTIANIPDGTSNTVGMVERYGYYPTYGWSPLWCHPAHPASPNGVPYWPWPQWSPTYGPWGLNPPQIGFRPNQAHPFHPNSGHTATVQVLLMDGSVRGVGAGVSQATWNVVVQPDDGSVIPGNW